MYLKRGVLVLASYIYYSILQVAALLLLRRMILLLFVGTALYNLASCNGIEIEPSISPCKSSSVITYNIIMYSYI